MTEKFEQLEVRQFKLASGEEILCEIVQWDEQGEIEILTRKAMRLIMQENGEGFKYYAFRPWMVYQECGEDLVVVNANHIVGIGFPTRSLLVQYYDAVADMEEMHITREIEYEETYGALKQPKTATERMQENIKNAESRDKIDEYLERMVDSASNNIIQFDSKKIH